jgi:hypothetical protein
VVYTKQAQKDARNIAAAGLKPRAQTVKVLRMGTHYSE